MSRAKNWVFTVHLHDEVLFPNWLPAQMHYLIYGHEVCPTTGQEHLQGYVQLRTAMTLKRAKGLLGIDTAHLEVARGTPLRNKEYCSKEGCWFEFGTAPAPRPTSLSDAVVQTLSSGGNIEDLYRINPAAALRYVSQFTKLLMEIRVPYEGPRKVLWFYGLTGTGKTRMARELLPEAPIVRLIGGFMHGYNCQKAVIIDEVRDGQLSFPEMLGLFDRYSMRANVKHGSLPWCVERCIVTSASAPSEFGTALVDDYVDQLIRRLTRVVLFKRDAVYDGSSGLVIDDPGTVLRNDLGITDLSGN